MFEIGIFFVIVLAVSYWAVLWTMGRREDVLHGEFVEHDVQSNEPAQSAIPAAIPKSPARRIFLDRPVFPERATLLDRPIFPKPPERPVRAAVPDQPAFRPERLESLLKSIKQDLNQLVRK
jgi:hypothetical protein